MSDREKFVKGLPKAELHIHIEGSLEPELMFELAARNGVQLPYASVYELHQAYNFANLQAFLDLYYQGMSVLITERDFHDLALAYFERCAVQNVRYAEIFFDPQGHTSRGVSFETVINGLTRATDDAERLYGIQARLIMCFLRHLTEDDAERTLDEALPYKNAIVGVGLDSSEVGFPPSLFKNVFRRAREEGLKLVAHAGEEGPPEYVWEALDVLGVDRIDHGNRALEDHELVNRLRADQMPLTVCPLSNFRLCGVTDMKAHPLRRMLELGLFVTVNSDDPAYFGGYMSENFMAVGEALDLDDLTLRKVARNGFAAAFMGDGERKATLLAFDKM